MEKYIDVINDYCLSNEKIKGLFYGGSIGRDDSDKYSDIDARIVVNQDFNIVQIKQDIINLFGNILFIEENNNTFMVIHLEDLMKIDVFLYTIESIVPSPWLKDIRIMKDFESKLLTIKNLSNDILVSPSQQQIQFISNKYIAFLIETYKRRNRNEKFYLDHMINQMTNLLCYLWYLEKQFQPNAIGDWSKYQGNRSKLDDLQLDILDYIKREKSNSKTINVLNQQVLLVIEKISDKYKLNNNLKKLINIVEDNQK
ncbi:nucleotidyltransferase domain-containing protein [Macrococcus animalis]|uniref:nucleotidyltransferase domain-containing protein n=1 Tax=Macrococcus animalis TaxID=3395467 RepID=UPI0039BE0F00